MRCPTCKGEHASSSHEKTRAHRDEKTCPYDGYEYAELRAGHDQLFFGKWRRLEAKSFDIRRAILNLERYLRKLDKTLETMDLPAAKRDLDKAFDAFYSADTEGGGRYLLYLDRALSYAHRVLDDMLHEKGFASHSPMDFASWYDAGEVPFREDW